MTDIPFALFDLESVAPRVSEALRSEPHPHERRIVADASDRVAWLRARSQGVTATDAAKLASRSSVRGAAYEKLHGSPRSFGGSRFTDRGRTRLATETKQWNALAKAMTGLGVLDQATATAMNATHPKAVSA